MIDVYVAAGTFSDQHALAQKLATELMTIEQVPDIPMFRKNTAAFIHDLPSSGLSNVDGDTTYVRVQGGEIDPGRRRVRSPARGRLLLSRRSRRRRLARRLGDRRLRARHLRARRVGR
jgi:hypothetical protein